MRATDQQRHSRIAYGIDRARELARLRDREASLVTVTTQPPVQLARLRERIAQLEDRSK